MPNFTKAAIKQSFIRLLNERPMKQITVRDIVEDCGINRNSFYYHFADIPTLLEEIITEQAEQIIAENPTVGSMEDCLLAAVRFGHENKRLILHIYHSVNRELYEQYLWKVTDAVVTRYADALLAGEQILEEDRQLFIRYMKGLCYGLSAEWISTGMHSDIEADIKRLCALKKGMAEDLLERCRASFREKQTETETPPHP